MKYYTLEKVVANPFHDLETRYQTMLEWTNICYSIKQKRKRPRKTILDDVSGIARAGCLLAIMGPSGAGKTTLINALAGRIEKHKGAEFTGKIFINGKQIDSKFNMSDVSAYVTQEDTLFPFSTIRETFAFASKLRNIPLVRVNEVIRELSLIQAADTRIGNAMVRGISGGEKKRVSIGIELLRNPGVIFLDEPTTGLDSYQALSVMNTLKQLSNSGRTVICSIHQPRSAIYALTDDLCVLTVGGRVVYFGQAGDDASNYFASTFPVPKNFNPADHFMDIVSVNYRSTETQERTENQVNSLVEMFRQKREYTNGTKSGFMGRKDLFVKAIKGLENRRGVCRQFILSFVLVLQRAGRVIHRNWALLGLQIFLKVFMNVIYGLAYYDMAFSQVNIANRTGLYFYVAFNLAFTPCVETAKTIPPQMAVVQKERLANLYGIVPYFISAFLVQLPRTAIPTLSGNAIMYFMANLRHGWDHFLIFLLTICCAQMIGNMVGMWFASMLSRSDKAVQFVQLYATLSLMFSGGSFLKESSIPSWLVWMKYLSFIRYPYQILLVNEFRDAHFEPDEPFDGNAWLADLGFEDVYIAQNFAYIGVIFLVYSSLAMFCMWMNRPKFSKLKDEYEIV